MSVICPHGPEHQAAEDRALLGDQERREGQPQDDPEELRPVADQHLERDPAHRVTLRSATSTAAASSQPSRPPHSAGATQPSAARQNDVIWSVRKSRSSASHASRPDQPLGDRPGHLVVQALADHAEGQGVQLPLVGLRAELAGGSPSAARTAAGSPRGSRRPRPRSDGASPGASADAASRPGR